MFATIGLTACIQDQGTTEPTNEGGSSSQSNELPPPSFEIPTAPGSGSGAQDPDAGTPVVVTPDPGPTIPTYDFGGLSLKGSDLVSTQYVDVILRPVFWSHMKLGFNADCNNGDWVIVTDQVRMPVINRNGNNVVTVKYSNGVRGDDFSDCYRVEFKHDDSAPNIVFKSYPAAVIKEGVAPEVIYEVTDANELVSVTCSLNGVSNSCPSGLQTAKFSPLPEGDYTFQIKAKDNFGLESQLAVSWKVEKAVRNVEQNFLLDEYRKVDILIVIDNSGSMSFEQKNMADRMGRFLSIIRGLDWQIGVTTTDPRTGTSVVGGDGRLLEFFESPGQYVIDSTLDETVAQRKLSQTVQRKEVGSGLEQGINAAYRAVERAISTTITPNHNARLFRPGARFATVLISDEDESATAMRNDPTNLINFVTSSFVENKSFSFHSIITRPDDKVCLDGEGASYGNRYKTITQLTGGILGSVCEMDYSSQVEGIANSIRNLLKTLTLTCVPIAGRPIEISINGQAYTAPFVAEGMNLRFSAELPPGAIKAKYTCLAE